MEFKDVLHARRSCRAFTDQPIGEEEIGRLISACQWAPSPLHLQPWEFIVITDPAVKGRVRQLAEQAKAAVVAADGPSWAAKYPLDFLDQSPVLIVVLFNPAKGGLGVHFNQPHGALQAASAGIQNMMLAGAEQGLGSLWFTFFDPDALAAELAVPDKLSLAGVIPFGHVADWPKAPPRKEARIYREAYGRE